jgi:hypothetical protein
MKRPIALFAAEPAPVAQYANDGAARFFSGHVLPNHPLKAGM